MFVSKESLLRENAAIAITTSLTATSI